MEVSRNQSNNFCKTKMSSSNTVHGRIPLFNGENYATWRAQMEGILHKGRFLKTVEGKEPRPQAAGADQDKWDDKDMDARSELLISMEPSIVSLVKNHKSSKEIWDFLESSYDRKSVRQKAEEFRKLVNIRMSSIQTMDEYLRSFNAIVNRLIELDAKLDDDLLVVLLLDSLDENFKDVQAAFDAQKDFPSLQTVRVRLMEVGDKKRESPVNNDALKVNHYSSHLNYYDSRNRKTKQTNQSSSSYDNKYCNYNCRRCGLRGHKAKNCQGYREKAKQVDELGSSEHGFIIEEYLHYSPRAFEATADYKQSTKYHWCLDSGATSHMCNNERAFAELSKGCLGYVKLANNEKVQIMGIGTVKIWTEVNNSPQCCSLFKTLYVPDLRENLISINKATLNDHEVVFEGNIAKIINKNQKTIVEAQRQGGLYIVREINEAACKGKEHKYKQSEDFETWHNRMGHLNGVSLVQLEREHMVVGLPKFQKFDLKCTACIQGKQTRLPFTAKHEKSTKRCLELIHTDICGPMKKESLSKSIYFVTFIDDYSRKIFVYFINKKSDMINKFKQFKSLVENQTNQKIKAIRSDNGSEYTSNEFREFCQTNGIKQQFSAEYTPQQNGIAERANRTLTEMARCLKIEGNLPEYLWAELVNTSAYIRNRCPTKVNANKTPEELWSSKKPDVSHFKKIGSRAFVLDKRGKNSKFQPRSEEYVLIGYSEDAKAYRLWKRGARSIVKSRDVKFIETVNHKTHIFYEFELETNQKSGPADLLKKKEGDSLSKDLAEEEEETLSDVFEEADDLEFVKNDFTNNKENEIQHTDQSQERDEIGSTMKKDKSTSLRSPRPKRKAAMKNLSEAANLVVIGDPKSLKEIEMSQNADEWRQAMKVEWNFLLKNKTWTLVDRPKNRNVIGCRWVFKTKYRPDGTVERRKARLVAKGYSQLYGVDYFETFAPVAEISSIRLLYGIATEYNLDIYHIDVSTAFLYGDLEEEIYMEQPPGFVNDNGKVCKLQKAIYGLKQSGHQWNKKLDSKLTEIGFKNSNYDRCVYFKRSQNTVTYITIYVDDVIIATNDLVCYKELKSHLKTYFDIRDMGEPKLTVGLEISRNRKLGTLSISQSGYIKNLIRNYGIFDCKPQKLPMPSKTKLEKEPEIDGENKLVDRRQYQELIGSLLHLSTFSRPDISCSVNMLSQFNQDPRKQHWNMAISVLKYLRGTQNAKITYRRTGQPICAYVDSSWAEDQNDRKSQSGMVFVFAGAAIDWESRKQHIIATSSAEAEYIALTTAAKRAAYFKFFLMEMGLHSEANAILMHTDSQSAQYIANYHGKRSRSKHLHIRFHYIREAIATGIVNLKYLSTDKMLADSLTKCTSNLKHYYCFENIGIEFF